MQDTRRDAVYFQQFHEGCRSAWHEVQDARILRRLRHRVDERRRSGACRGDDFGGVYRWYLLVDQRLAAPRYARRDPSHDFLHRHNVLRCLV